MVSTVTDVNRKDPHLDDDDDLEPLCLVKPTPNPTPKAIAKMRKPTSPMTIQKDKPRRFCCLSGSCCVSGSCFCDARSGRNSIFANGVPGGGEPASFSVSASLSGFGEPYSSVESPRSLKSGLEGV